MLFLLLGCATLRPVTVSVVGAELAPVRADGTAWDGPGAEARDALGILGAAVLTGDPFAGSLLGIAGSVAATLERPDPLGDAVLRGPAGDLHLALPVRDDTFTPSWCADGGACPALGPVRLRDVDALELSLVDDDLDDDDPIDVVVLDRAALVRLLRSGETTVEVQDQGTGEVLRVRVAVRPTRTGPAAP